MDKNHPKMRAGLTGKGRQVDPNIQWESCPEHGVESRAECEGRMYCLRMWCDWQAAFMHRKGLVSQKSKKKNDQDIWLRDFAPIEFEEGEMKDAAKLFGAAYLRTSGEVEIFTEVDRLEIRPSNTYSRVALRFKDGLLVDVEILEEQKE